MEFGGEGSSCLLSHLPWSSLLSGWCCPPLSHVFGVICQSLLLFFLYIKAPGPIPTPHPHPALRLIYLSLQMRLLCFQPLLLQYP